MKKNKLFNKASIYWLFFIISYLWENFYMKTIDELYDILMESNIDLALVGDISLEDESIKWFYDGLGCVTCDIDEYLKDIFNTDAETIEDFLLDKNLDDYFYFGQPEINDTMIIVYMYEE